MIGGKQPVGANDSGSGPQRRVFVDNSSAEQDRARTLDAFTTRMRQPIESHSSRNPIADACGRDQ
jgi:hypothetical protein